MIVLEPIGIKAPLPVTVKTRYRGFYVFAIKAGLLEFRLHAQIIHDESVNVGLLFKYFCHRFACTVSGFAVDADQCRVWSRHCRLAG